MAGKSKAPMPMHRPAETEEASGDLRGMDRSFAVLEFIAQQPSRVVDVTKALGLPWATVHRTLTQLEKAQFLRKDTETNRFEIGPRLWHIGSAYLSNHRVLQAALTYLSQSQDIEGIAVQIVERIGFQSVAIYSAQRLAEDITKAHFGFHFPLHCGSKGQVLLAFEEPEFVDQYLRRKLEKLTNETVTDPVMLRAMLGDIRRKGMALTVGDVQPFTASIAAPIREASNRVVASLCFVFRKSLLRNEARMEELQDRIIHTAHSISFDLGWRPGQE
ncbi:MAG: IclR family transcriptional regulator [Alphaproteobacteria bacterium]|nr:IclR family transcriptional regulator [Alphaproteobacteria bacterium]